MKKLYFLAVMAMLAMSTTSCQKDDFSDAPVKTATVVSNNNTNGSTSSSTTSSTSNASTVYYKVQITNACGTLTANTDVCSLAMSAVRDYYKNLLGSDVTVGATCGSYFRMRGEAHELEVNTKIMNTSVTDLDNALAKSDKLIAVSFTVYDKNGSKLFEHSYQKNLEQNESGNQNAK